VFGEVRLRYFRLKLALQKQLRYESHDHAALQTRGTSAVLTQSQMLRHALTSGHDSMVRDYRSSGVRLRQQVFGIHRAPFTDTDRLTSAE
jgi:hypothetical protein